MFVHVLYGHCINNLTHRNAQVNTQYIVVCTHNARVENDDRIEEKKPCGWILITHRENLMELYIVTA